MICPDCRKGNHSGCPERKRQADTALPLVQRLGGSLCDCQHEPPQTGTSGRA